MKDLRRKRELERKLKRDFILFVIFLLIGFHASVILGTYIGLFL